eukprot:TRINITY_DN3299_c0_g1_i1.p1 TRINITY_DN3299_c0_g1~~TRINITY_DN3299_c0_g1_i1.p1  ORF type:complete len:282 (-),score=-19.34 TRINITY_DN3299_c0_g1_i1:634-1479(-)
MIEYIFVLAYSLLGIRVGYRVCQYSVNTYKNISIGILHQYIRTQVQAAFLYFFTNLMGGIFQFQDTGMIFCDKLTKKLCLVSVCFVFITTIGVDVRNLLSRQLKIINLLQSVEICFVQTSLFCMFQIPFAFCELCPKGVFCLPPKNFESTLSPSPFHRLDIQVLLYMNTNILNCQYQNFSFYQDRVNRFQQASCKKQYIFTNAKVSIFDCSCILNNKRFCFYFFSLISCQLLLNKAINNLKRNGNVRINNWCVFVDDLYFQNKFQKEDLFVFGFKFSRFYN